MARARNIKPGFFTNDVLAECSALSRLLFQGLWCHADREGRLEDRPRKIKAEILPYDDCDIEELLQQLSSRGFIVRYQTDSGSYIQVVNFGKHQNPHMKEPASTIPAPCLSGENTGISGTGPADSLNLIPDTPSLIPDTSTRKRTGHGYSEEFETAWAAYPKRPGASKADSVKAWNARIKEGVDPQTIYAGVVRYAAYCKATISSPKYIKQPATFFGSGRHYESTWEIPEFKEPANTQRQINQEATTRAIFGTPRQTEKLISGEVVQ